MDKHTGLERESLAIKGVRSELRLEGGRITIVKEATTQAHPTSVEVDVRTVRGSTLENPKRGGRGWFHIATVNGSPAPVGELAASGDPYALPITKGAVGSCKKLQKLIEKHVKERGLPADVGPNQGRFTSGVVVQSAVKPVAAPMVTVPEPAASSTGASASAGEAEAEDSPVVEVEPPRKRAAAKRAAAKRTTAKKAAAKKATKKRVPAKKATAKKAASTKTATAKKAAASGAAGDDRAAAAGELVTHLKELASLHEAGILDDAEFAAAKAKVLG